MRCDETRIPTPIADPLTRTETTMLPPTQPEVIGVNPSERDFRSLDRQFLFITPIGSELEIAATDTKLDCVNLARRHAVAVIVATKHDVPPTRLWPQDSPPNNGLNRSRGRSVF